MATKTKTKAKAKAPAVHVTLATFDLRGDRPKFRVVRGGEIGKFSAVTSEDYCPSGSTPLRDASMEFIAHLEAEHKAHPQDVVIGLLMDESGSMGPNREASIVGVNEFVEGMADVEEVDADAGGKVLAVILTDGLENASTEVSADRLRQEIADREKQGWTFIYLGSNQDAWSAGSTYGFSGTAQASTINYEATPKGTSSALRAATNRGVAYISDNASYPAHYYGQTTALADDDGAEVQANMAEAQARVDKAAAEAAEKAKKQGSSMAAEALEQARKATER